MTKGTLQTAVLGVSGYAGMELARLLLHHPNLEATKPIFFGRDAEPLPLTEIHPQLADNNGSSSLVVEPFSWELAQSRGVELLFLATPHEHSRSWVPEALAAGLRVIDLSGAWRLQHGANRAVYNFHDADEALASEVQSKSVYGMPELHRERIRQAQLVANPGCYATSVILGLKPLVNAGWIDLHHGIICDAKSGVSGAGKAPTATTHFMYAADNLSAYGLFGHRHLGEMIEQLGVREEEIVFTPHLLPIPRGILSTIYVTLREKKQTAEVEALFRDFYATSPLVRIFGAAPAAGDSSRGASHGAAKNSALPQIQYSVRTNYGDLGVRVAKDGRRCIVVSCLDNLLKGAAGQAVQNMNLMCGWDEAEGLK
jgi:N-acetyl-gamma-glutamyl-phosphate reductase